MNQQEYTELHAKLDKLSSDIRELINTDLEKSKEMLSHFLNIIHINKP